MKARALWAEFIGTFALIFVGMMAIATNALQQADAVQKVNAASHSKGAALWIAVTGAMNNGDIGRVGIALAHGFIIAVMVWATMAVSGGHLNPAVTFGLWLGKRITLKRLLGYWVVQIAGGIAGAFVASAVLPTGELLNANIFNSSYGLPQVAKFFMDPDQSVIVSGVPIYALLIEAILTFFLMYVVLATAAERRVHKIGALFIGLTVTLDILAGGPLTGAAMNPARWLGPAFVVSGEPAGGAGGVIGAAAYANWAVYIIGPLLGAAIAGIAYGRVPEQQEAYGALAEETAGVLPR
ncbi:MAG: aquaporin [Fimbriimonadaceae bacterium]|jgi:aquaporin Z|nr:aquaporin [Fimbriimonadaceae bacterium]